MENKSKLNTVLLIIIVILLVTGFGFILLNNSKKEIINIPIQEKSDLISKMPRLVSNQMTFDDAMNFYSSENRIQEQAFEDSLICKSTNIKATVVTYQKREKCLSKENGGCPGFSSLGILCSDKYIVMDSSSSFGAKYYGPFDLLK
jgi:hypothetical protein